MTVVSLADFASNSVNKSAPCRIVDNGVEIGKFVPTKQNLIVRLFARKDDTIDGVHRPTRQLKAALRESKYMEKHPEKYKSYNNIDEVFAELGIKL